MWRHMYNFKGRDSWLRLYHILDPSDAARLNFDDKMGLQAKDTRIGSPGEKGFVHSINDHLQKREDKPSPFITATMDKGSVIDYAKKVTGEKRAAEDIQVLKIDPRGMNTRVYCICDVVLELDLPLPTELGWEHAFLIQHRVLPKAITIFTLQDFVEQGAWSRTEDARSSRLTMFPEQEAVQNSARDRGLGPRSMEDGFETDDHGKLACIKPPEAT